MTELFSLLTIHSDQKILNGEYRFLILTKFDYLFQRQYKRCSIHGRNGPRWQPTFDTEPYRGCVWIPYKMGMHTWYNLGSVKLSVFRRTQKWYTDWQLIVRLRFRNDSVPYTGKTILLWLNTPVIYAVTKAIFGLLAIDRLPIEFPWVVGYKLMSCSAPIGQL